MPRTSVIDVGDNAPLAEPSVAWWLVVAFIAFWAGLLAHEAAHYGVGRLVLTPDDWTSTASISSEWLQELSQSETCRMYF